MTEAKLETEEALLAEVEELRHQLFEAQETIEAIRTGGIDALVVEGRNGNELYTLSTADQAYRRFIEKMSEGAVTVNPEGLIIYCNSQFAAMVAKPLSTVIGVPFEEFIARTDSDFHETIIRRCGAGDCKEEVLLTTGLGTIPVLLSLASVEMEQGSTMNILVTDLTAQKQAQKELEETNIRLEHMNEILERSNHALQQFAHVASHDMKEPVRKVRTFAARLKDEYSAILPDRARNFLGKIEKASERMYSMIEGVLQYSSFDGQEQEMEEVALTEVLEQIQTDVELLIQEKSASIQYSDLPVVYGHPVLIYQLFYNLINNSLKFARTGIPLRIVIESREQAAASGGSIEVKVTDNGIGFHSKDAKKIFQTFARLHPKDHYEGTGLGLALCRNIVERHGGTIDGDGVEGEGAVFTIVFPKGTQGKSN